MTKEQLVEVILSHWKQAYEEMPTGMYEDDVTMICHNENIETDTPTALAILGFVAGMNHGLTIAAAIKDAADKEAQK